MDRRLFLKLLSAYAATSGISKLTGNPGKSFATESPNPTTDLDREREQLMNHIRRQFEDFKLRKYYKIIKSKFKFPSPITNYLDKRIAREWTDGIDLAKSIVLQMETETLSAEDPLIGGFMEPATYNIWLSPEVSKRDLLLRRQELSYKRNIQGLSVIVEKGFKYLSDFVPGDKKTSKDVDLLYGKGLRKLRDDLIKDLFDIDLDVLRSHISNYKKDDLAIFYASIKNPVEAIQAFFSEPLLLYIQMAFGKRAAIFWPTRNANGSFTAIEDALKNPSYCDLAIIGHGQWSSVSLGGMEINPEDYLVKLIMQYNENPRKTASEFTSSLIRMNHGGMFLEDNGQYITGKDAFGISVMIKPFSSKKTGRLAKYTCGTARFDIGDVAPLGHPDLKGMIHLTGHMFERDRKFSALSPVFTQTYHRKLVQAFKSHLQDKMDDLKKELRRGEKFAQQILSRPKNKNYTIKYYEEDQVVDVRYKNGTSDWFNLGCLRKDIARIEGTLDRGDITKHFEVRERPLFGTSLMADKSKIYSYEGIAWLSDYLKTPFPEITQHNLKL